MTTICAKCRMVRPQATEAPAWQCPGCGVAYVKAQGGGSAQPMASHARHVPARIGRDHSGGLPWGKILALLVLVWGLYAGHQAAQKRGWTGAGGGVSSLAARLNGSATPEQLSSLATAAQPADVFMYSADWCPNCRQAQGWLASNGFKYQTCDIDRDAGCGQRLKELGSDGVPYLIVKGHHMKDGFDSEEFVTAMRGR